MGYAIAVVLDKYAIMGAVMTIEIVSWPECYWQDLKP